MKVLLFYDYFHPPKTVIGETDDRAGDMLASLYEDMDAPMIRTSVETAEMVKYTDNVWHAVKVGFANEIGNICKAVQIDGHEVMDIFLSGHQTEPICLLHETWFLPSAALACLRMSVL